MITAIIISITITIAFAIVFINFLNIKNFYPNNSFIMIICGFITFLCMICVIIVLLELGMGVSMQYKDKDKPKYELIQEPVYKQIK